MQTVPEEAISQSYAIKPSNTPLNRYDLYCPMCNEQEVYLHAENPDEPYCKNCDDVIDIEALTVFLTGWMEYLSDRQALLLAEKKQACGAQQ